MKLKKTLNFGKIAFDSNRKVNEVEIEISLDDGKGYPVFSACGAIWDSRHNDWTAGGQCLDSLLPHLKGNELFLEVHELWTKYHLNDFHAGTKRQEKEVKKHFNRQKKEENRRYDYTTACEVLKKRKLYWDSLEDDEVLSFNDTKNTRKRYAYGTGWVLWKIPEDDLKRIRRLFGEEV